MSGNDVEEWGMGGRSGPSSAGYRVHQHEVERCESLSVSFSTEHSDEHAAKQGARSGREEGDAKRTKRASMAVIRGKERSEKQAHDVSEGRREHRKTGGAERRPERA